MLLAFLSSLRALLERFFLDCDLFWEPEMWEMSSVLSGMTGMLTWWPTLKAGVLALLGTWKS